MTIHDTKKRASFVPKDLRFSERYSAESLADKTKITDNTGSWFLTMSAKMIDMAKVLIVGVFVDTVRQLYNGVLDEGFLSMLEACLNKGDNAKLKATYPSAVLPFGEFAVQKMGKSCGYRYKLQNNEIGLVILVGSYYHKPEKSAPHLKIECSPRFIALHNPKMLQIRLDTVARSILHGWDYQGVAVHLAVDIQGWRPGADFMDKFVTYARMVRNYLGLQTAEIGQGFTDVVCKYGEKESETITIGKPSGLQTSIYNKTKQIKVIDKIDEYQKEWEIFSLGRYDKNGPDVYRVEYRFHHSVTKEFEINGQSGFVNFEQIAKHLTTLFRYALIRNRLDIESKHIHPVWQMLYQDVEFNTEPPFGLVKRVKKNDLSAIGKNIQLLLGNYISIMARQTDDAEKLFKGLKRMGVYDDFIEYYRKERKMGETEFREKCAKSLIDRRMLRNAA